MTRKEQKEHNDACLEEWDSMIGIFNDVDRAYIKHSKRLRSCNAIVYWHNVDNGWYNVYLLRSYNTFVAGVMVFYGIDGKLNYLCVDALRYEYGYTSTSAHHIAKFFNDYARFPARVNGGNVIEYRYYPVKGD